ASALQDGAAANVEIPGSALGASGPGGDAFGFSGGALGSAGGASGSANPGGLCDISMLDNVSGKGMVYFVSLCNVAEIRRTMDMACYATTLASIDDKLRSLLPGNAVVSSYSGENWVIAISETNETDSHLGKEICQLIDQTINSASEAANSAFTAIGISKYGVADMTARDAIEKAFHVCASQLASGGFKLFAPRIDNAQGSAALKSAMELDRLKIKYQPVIGLHNQSTQWYDAFVFMRNDAGVEQDAAELLESLGIEKDNVALDQWLVSQSIDALSSLVYENPNISLSVPLTASAVSDEKFVDWLIETVQASGLPKDSISFNVSAEHAQSYEAKCRKLFTKLLENGFKTTIKGVASEQTDIV
ncbi:MAG: EAL domain-containing protein, partial [Pseudomonadales bacterium]|nr:EAL domain-containing protein [Pseudomonadales bacterium]